MERAGDRAADAAAGAGDQRDLVGEIEHRGQIFHQSDAAKALEIGGGVERDTLGVGGDPLDHAGEHLSGADLGESVYPALLTRKPLDALAPADAAGHLFDEKPADPRSGSITGRAVTLATSGA